jgi:hypothetical protein
MLCVVCGVVCVLCFLCVRVRVWFNVLCVWCVVFMRCAPIGIARYSMGFLVIAAISFFKRLDSPRFLPVRSFIVCQPYIRQFSELKEATAPEISILPNRS